MNWLTKPELSKEEYEKKIAKLENFRGLAIGGLFKILMEDEYLKGNRLLMRLHWDLCNYADQTYNGMTFHKYSHVLQSTFPYTEEEKKNIELASQSEVCKPRIWEKDIPKE